jgi:hypothetical protein
MLLCIFIVGGHLCEQREHESQDAQHSQELHQRCFPREKRRPQTETERKRHAETEAEARAWPSTEETARRDWRQ